MEAGNLELLNELGEWEVGIGLLKELRILDLRGNHFATFPEQIERLELLEELYLSDNRLAEIPQDIGTLENLKILHIQNNHITKIATDFYHLKNLLELRGEHNELYELPPTEAELHPNASTTAFSSALKSIDFSFNRFAHLDDRWTHFAALKTLSLAHNALESMSENCFSHCRALTHLDLSHNKLTDVSLSLQSAVHLSHCDLSFNQLSDAPQALFRCTKLKTLNMSHNALREITGRVMGMLLDLERLEVQHNEIQRLPALLFALKKVKHFDCSHNSVPELPVEVETWSEGVEYLDLSYNRLQSLPSAITACGKLEYLFLDHNALQDLPAQLHKLKALKKLTLQNNSLHGTRHVLALLPWLLHSNLSWNRDVTVRALYSRSARAANEEERRFTLFGRDLEEHYAVHADELQSMSFLRKRLFSLDEELESVVQSLPARERAFAVDANAVRGRERNFETLLRWLAKLREHVLLDENRREKLIEDEEKQEENEGKDDQETLKKREERTQTMNRHADLKERLCHLYELRNTQRTDREKRQFHDLLVQALSARLAHASKTHTKVYHSHSQFRQLRPLMYYAFPLDGVRDETNDERLARPDEREYLTEDVANALFLGFELVPSIERLCELLDDLNLLAVIEELNSARESRAAQEHIAIARSAAKSETNAAESSRQVTAAGGAAGTAEERAGEAGAVVTALTVSATATATSQKSRAPSFSVGRLNVFARKTSQQFNAAPAEDALRARQSRDDQDKRAREDAEERMEIQRLRALPLPSEPVFTADDDQDGLQSGAEIEKNYFSEILARLAPFIDVDLVDRASARRATRAVHAPLPLMSFPFLTLLARDERGRESFGKTHHSQDEPFGAESLFSLLFEVNLSLCKALVMHVECVQKSVRALERVSGERFSRLAYLCQRDAYYKVSVNEKTHETEVHLQEDYEDILADIYASIRVDKESEEKMVRVSNSSIGQKKRQHVQSFVEQFFAAGELDGVEFVATESIFKQRNERQGEGEGEKDEEERAEGEKNATQSASLSVSHSLSQSVDFSDERTAPHGEEENDAHAALPAQELLLQALGLPTRDERERERERLKDLDDSLLMINAASPSAKDLETMRNANAVRETLRETHAKRVLIAQNRVRVWSTFLLEYRELLFTWATQCMENCMMIVQSRGFDLHQSEWEMPIKQMSYDFRDERFLKRQEEELLSMAMQGNGNGESDMALSMKREWNPSRKMYFWMSPVVVRHVEDEARRCMMYRFRLFQCVPQFQDCVASYQAFLKCSKGAIIPLKTYIGYVKICLSQGNFTQARDLLVLSMRTFLSKELRAYWEHVAKEAKKSILKKKIVIPEDDKDLAIPKASDLLQINQEIAVLWRFTEIQIQALNKVGVYSKENQRVYRVREDGLMRMNEDYKAPEIIRGRDLQYQKRTRQLEEQQKAAEKREIERKQEEEILETVIDVKTKMMALLKQEGISELAQNMKLDDLFD